MDLPCGKCIARSDCTHVQLDLVCAALSFISVGETPSNIIKRSFTKRQNFRLVQIESKQQKNCDCKIEIRFEKGRKHFGKRRKCLLPAFSPFPTMIFKGIFFKVVKSRDYVVKG